MYYYILKILATIEIGLLLGLLKVVVSILKCSKPKRSSSSPITAIWMFFHKILLVGQQIKLKPSKNINPPHCSRIRALL